MTQIPRILFNCTTNVMGGAVQNAANFISLAMKDKNIDWRFAVSPEVADCLESLKEENTGTAISVFKSPARSLLSGLRLRDLSEVEDVAGVYTMAGPAYVRFRLPHIMGVSNPFITNARWDEFRLGRNVSSASSLAVRAFFQGLFAKSADRWLFQTASSRDGFCRRWRVSESDTSIIPNAVSDIFLVKSQPKETMNSSRGWRILCPAAPYPHKNLHSLLDVGKELARQDSLTPYRFVVTLPYDSKIWRQLDEKRNTLPDSISLENVGPFPYREGPNLYATADIVFMPSGLEVFSTSYIEAMATGKPLVVSDRPFAREVCQSGALYYDIKDPQAAAHRISMLLRSSNLSEQIAKEQKIRVSCLITHKERYELIRKAIVLFMAHKRPEHSY